MVTLERGFAGWEKHVDASLVTRVCRDAYRFGDPRRDRITLVAGDGDYTQAVDQIMAGSFGMTVLCPPKIANLPSPAGRADRPLAPASVVS